MKSRVGSASGHGVRVGALAFELGGEMGLDQMARERLRTAGHLHEQAPELLSQAALERLAADILDRDPVMTAQPPVAPDTLALLRAFTSPRYAPPGTSREVEILMLADAIDNEQEMEPYCGAEPDEPPSEVADAISRLRCVDRGALRDVARCLPAFPQAASRALAVLSGADVELADIEQVASSDPVLAGVLLSAANSARYLHEGEIRTVGRAVSQVGTDTARAVLLAAALRPVFASPALRPHWAHSLEAADAARHLAARTGAVPVDEAVVAALLHDIGLLAISLTAPEAVARCQRLIDAGYPRLGAERLSCGFDHAEASEVVLEAWRLPPTIGYAVRYHHTPEQCDSDMAALLYLVEFWTCSEEDLPSRVRLMTAARRLHIPEQAIIELKPESCLRTSLPA